MPYILIYSYLFTTFLYQTLIQKKNKYLEAVLNFKSAIVILFIFVAIRGTGNGDYETYLYSVGKVTSLDFVFNPVDYHLEFAFRVLSYIVNLMNLHPQFVLATMNAISFSCVYYFVNKYSRNKELSLVLFFPIVLLFDMHHSRSAVVISLGLIFFDQLITKQYLRAFAVLILAMLFHKTSLILITLLPIALLKNFEIMQFKFKNRTFLKGFIILFIVLIFYFVNPINFIIQLLNNPLTSSIHYKLVSYLANDRWSYPFKLYDPRLWMSILVFLSYDFTNSYKNQFNNKLQLIQAYSICTMILFSVSTILVIRLSNFFNIFSIVLIPNLLFSINLDSIKIGFERIRIEISNVWCLRLRNFISFLIVGGYVLYTLLMIKSQFEYHTVFMGIFL